MTEEKTSPKFRPAPDGWSMQSHLETFSGQSGPFYFRDAGEEPGVGFFAEPRHANMGGVLHGGVLLTLADMALWDICKREIGFFKGVTVTMNAEFVGAGPIGGFIEATGEMVKAGGKLMFARGLISADGAPLMSFSGTLKRVG